MTKTKPCRDPLAVVKRDIQEVYNAWIAQRSASCGGGLPYGRVTETEVGLYRFHMHIEEMTTKRSGWLYGRFDDSDRASLRLPHEIYTSGKWNHYFDNAEQLKLILRRLENFGAHRPKYILCIADTDDQEGRAWCGDKLTSGGFLDIDYAVTNGRAQGRYLACAGCVLAVITALKSGADGKE